MIKRLDYKELKNNYEKGIKKFETTKDLKSYTGLIGQERAEKAFEFGLEIDSKGYNIYVSGESGGGKIDFSKKFALEKAKKDITPNDLCYVYNFLDSNNPKALYLEPGQSIIFKSEMEELIEIISSEIFKLYNSSDFEKKRIKLVKEFQNTRTETMKLVSAKAKEKNYGVKITNDGMYFLPYIKEKLMSEEEFEELSEEEKNNIDIIVDGIKDSIFYIMRGMKEEEKKLKIRSENLEFSETLFVVNHHLGTLMIKYLESSNVLEYLKLVKEDILENREFFSREENFEDAFNISPAQKTRRDVNFLKRYKINVMVNNADLKGAPVIISYSPSYLNIIGEIEYDNEFGNLNTDFTKIKPGLLHKANGGYLILRAEDVLKNNYVWETLRNVLLSSKLTVEPLKEFSTGLTVSYVKPEYIDLKVKIILVGSSYFYGLLDYHDEEFINLFRVRADFDYEMDSTEKNKNEIIGFIKNFVDKENLLDFDYNACIRILRYFERLSGEQNKLTTNFNSITEILIESSMWAKLDKKNLVSKNHIEKALAEKLYRVNIYENKLDRLIKEGTIMIDTEGKVVGQINGLSVIETSDYTFGKPSRITATTCIGEADIINIEKESDMSGNIHDKGVQVLSGYLGQKYAQDFPLSLLARVCFEQNYSGIDGDSASSTELYAIISSLTNLPINQEIAVTGSMNQFGKIQPIGGVSQKIEGFFDVCEKRNLTGNQGVIIPYQNIKDLVLEDKILSAIKENKFHIYPIENIDEGLEILLEKKAGQINSRGNYPKNSIHKIAYDKLQKFYEIINDEE